MAVSTAAFGDRTDWLGVLADAWAFHIAVDRAPGYGAQFALVSRIEYSRSSDVMPDGTPPK